MSDKKDVMTVASPDNVASSDDSPLQDMSAAPSHSDSDMADHDPAPRDFTMPDDFTISDNFTTYGHPRSVKRAMSHGIRNKCPRCGKAPILYRYLKVHDQCSVCEQNFSGHRADDAPAYFTMLIAGHLVIPIALEVRRIFDPPLGLQFLICILVLGILVYFLLPMTKGALIGIQWARRMHGFAHDTDTVSDG